MSSHDNHGIGTKAIHAGQTPDPSTGAVMVPIYATSTFAQIRPGETVMLPAGAGRQRARRISR
mgnify:CR=1 FL=1